jgi:CRP-like cAMP-binding protein
MREAALAQMIRRRSNNRLLATLSQKAMWDFRPHLEPIFLARGAVLCTADESMRRVHFVEGGIVSLITENRSTVVVATVGREGAVGGPTLSVGGGIAFGRYQVLVAGSALAMPAPYFQIALRENPQFRSLCEAYTQAFFAQVLQNVACSTLHTAEQRCARWLLTCDDQAEDDRFELTQGSVTSMLGVPELEADAVARRLRQVGAIRVRKGLIAVLGRRKLEAIACECYHIVHDRYERTFARTYDGGPAGSE